ncbi:MAG TPA: hypothetical protein VE988_03715 [Gemmataceae bacterium]|nr:hypothetical protein [Gemmataceae bacterium]
MQGQFSVTSYVAPVVPRPAEGTVAEVSDLLRQLLDVQREQLTQLKQSTAQQDGMARWRALAQRWKDDYPDMADCCKDALPILEKAYGFMVSAMANEICEQGVEGLETEFAMADFLDRYGMKLGQMGNILNVVGPLAEIATQNESQQAS